VSYAQAGEIDLNEAIDLKSLRPYRLPEAAPAAQNGTHY